MSKPPWRIDEILFPKSGLKTGDSTFGTIRPRGQEKRNRIARQKKAGRRLLREQSDFRPKVCFYWGFEWDISRIDPIAEHNPKQAIKRTFGTTPISTV
jgi:hypothetical protein